MLVFQLYFHTGCLFISWNQSYCITASKKDRQPSLGRFPTLFEKYRGFFNFPWIGLTEIKRLDEQLNVPTQVDIAQMGDKRPFSLTAPRSDLHLGIEPRLHWLMLYQSAI